MPYHDPFRHEHLFDLDIPPRHPNQSQQQQPQSLPHHPNHSHTMPNPSSRPLHSNANARPPQPRRPCTRFVRRDDQNLGTASTVASKFFANASGKRTNADITMYQALKAVYAEYPEVEVIDTEPGTANIYEYLLATGEGKIEDLKKGEILESLFCGEEESGVTQGHREYAESASAGDNEGAGEPATVATRGLAPVNFRSKVSPDSMNVISYVPPARRLDGGTGYLVADPLFDRFLVKWRDHEFEIYIVDVRESVYQFPEKRQYIVTADPDAALLLVKEAGIWGNLLHGEIWVYDSYWQKDSALFNSIQKSRWEDIILPEELKGDLLKTVLRFYDSRSTYERLRVPWKRGLIFYGPPGNGKTVSIKATMKTLFDREESIPTLYVKSLRSFGGPEYSINEIFYKAREQAPCYLVFEDLDSLVVDEVRSFFLNAVDGLSENQGILMVGSTNHLERLDPGIAKRPSRFDRKYLFPDPALEERKRYCQLWQKKLGDSDDVKFPDKLVAPIAGLMDGFSFAYMQEAFVSTLLKIASDQQGEQKEDEHWDLVDKLDKGDDGEDDELNKYILWREIKIQIANLKKEVDRGDK